MPYVTTCLHAPPLEEGRLSAAMALGLYPLALLSQLRSDGARSASGYVRVKHT